MPQHDTDPAILAERAYAEATTIILMDGLYEDWHIPSAYSDRRLSHYRAGVHQHLLAEFPDMESADLIAELDDALRDHNFPFHRA